MAKEPAKKVKMPTALKRDLQNEKKRLRNKTHKSTTKTVVRTFEESLRGKDQELIKVNLSTAFSALDKAVKHGIYSRNKADRSKARLSAKACAVKAG